MRKEIAPELYNYNKFPGPEFHVNGTQDQETCYSCIIQVQFLFA